MTPPRVLIVDDSAVARQAISKALREAGMEVAALAPNGRVGVAAVESTRPDAVVLDLEMPEMDGMAFLRRVRPGHPNLPIIVFSALTTQGAAASLAAMSAGASAYALKPSALRGSGPGDLEAELIPQLQALLQHSSSSRRGSAAAPARARALAPATGEDVRAIAVAVSTGGPNTLSTLIAQLPRDLKVPIFVVQHMPPTFTRMLAQRLAAAGPVAVVEAQHDELVRPGVVYIAPGGRHLVPVRGPGGVRVRLTDEPPENSCRPAADVTFRAAVNAYGSGVLGVVLTGMGRDGTAGARAIVAAGGSVLAQDPDTAVVGSMPASVLDAELAYAAFDIDGLAGELRNRLGAGPA